jgi:hypothetical protein
MVGRKGVTPLPKASLLRVGLVLQVQTDELSLLLEG